MSQGRPSKYTPKLVEEICRRLAEGQTLIRICKDKHMPDKSQVCRWLAQNKGDFRDQYAQAREWQADYYGDETIEIADDASYDWKERIERGKASIVCDYEHVQRSKLRIDARKWHASKTAPKKWGERSLPEQSSPQPLQRLTVTVRPAPTSE